MTTDTRTGADIVGTSLARAGATHAFGVPGGEVLGLMQGLDNAGINFALVRHENAGGFFAEGLWHSAGSLPILVATLGPGVANAVNVVANAMQDRVPLIFLTGCVDAAEAESYTHQVLDHQALLSAIDEVKIMDFPEEDGTAIGDAVVMGAEGDGMRRLTRENCDYLAKLPMAGTVSSVNVSVATGICLFEAVRQRQS